MTQEYKIICYIVINYINYRKKDFFMVQKDLFIIFIIIIKKLYYKFNFLKI